MINKLLFILLLFLFTSLSSKAQVTYPTWEWAVTDSSVLVGDWCMFEHHFYTVGNNFTRWDTNGNKLLTNHLVQGKQLIFDNHQHAFVLGIMTVDSLVFPNTTLHKQGTSDVLIYKLDTLGNILWVKNLGGPLADDCNQFCIDYQDNLYLTGYLQGTNGIHKLDSSGSYLWSKEIEDMNGAGSVVYRHIAYSQFDSTIVIGGSYVDTFHLDLLAVIDCYSNPNDPNQPSDNYLAKLDLNGHAIFLKSCALSCQWSDGFFDLSIKPTTGEIFYIYWYNGLNDVNHLGLTKCSLSGVTLSTLTYGTNYTFSGPFYHIEKISFDQDSLLGLLCNSTSEMFVLKIFNSQQNNLIRTYDATIPYYPTVMRLLFENGRIYFYDGLTFRKMGTAPLSITHLNDTTICSNNSSFSTSAIVLSGNPPFTCSWQPTSGISNPNILNPIFTLSNSASYTLTVTDSTGYMVSDTIHFNYQPSPIDSIISNSNLYPCYGDSSAIILSCANPSLQNSWYKNTVLMANDADSILVIPNCIYTLKTTDTTSGCYINNTKSIYYHPAVPVIIANNNNITLPRDTCYSSMLLTYKNYVSNPTTNIYWLKNGLTVSTQAISLSVVSSGQYILKVDDLTCELSDTIVFLPSEFSHIYQTICENQLPMEWLGQTMSTAGVYSHTFQNIYSCDSVVTLHLYLKTNPLVTQNLTLCPYELPIVWNGQVINTIGSYNYVTTGMNGCDSTSILNLTIDSLSPPINWNGIYLSTSSSFVTYQWLLNGNMINGAMDSTYTPIQNGNYQVVVTNANGCYDTSALFPMSAMAWPNHYVLIIPNPAKDLATLYFDHEFTGTIQVMDSRGQILETHLLEKVQSKNLDVSHYANGVYLIKVSGEHENEVMKLRVDRD